MEYGQKGLEVKRITDYPPEKQAEWAALQGKPKDTPESHLDTTAPQKFAGTRLNPSRGRYHKKGGEG